MGNKRDGNVHTLGFQLAYLSELGAPFTDIQSKERSDFQREHEFRFAVSLVMPLEHPSDDVKKTLDTGVWGTEERAGLKLCICESLYNTYTRYIQ